MDFHTRQTPKKTDKQNKKREEKRMVGDDEEDEDGDEVHDVESIIIENQIKEMSLSIPPAPVQDVDPNSPFAEAADITAESADITTATTIIDTTSPSFSTYSVAGLSTWLTTTIKSIPQSILSEIENNEVDGSVAIELDKNDWKELGLSGLQSAKVIAGIRKLLLKDDSN